MIEVDRVSFSYDADAERPIPALHEVSLTVRPGEFVALVGHNGSGKSTLGKHLNGLLLPSKGEVRVDGVSTRDAARLPSLRQAVGVVFQNPDNQILGSTVEDDVAFGPENLGLPRQVIRERVEEALELLGIADIRHEPPHLLSGGQKQRVAIAGVVAMRPRYIVLDEPTALLDPAGRAEVLDAVCRLWRQEGVGVVLITHFMDETVEADRILVMEGGRVVLEGTPRDVFTRTAEIRALRLDVPLVPLVVEGLRRRGIPLPTDTLTTAELIEQLCPSR